MEAYSVLAEYYDEFMKDIPYDEWCGFVCDYLSKNNAADAKLLELGCGTGNISFRLEKAGYDVTATDISMPMLKKALQKKKKCRSKIRFGLMDMRSIMIEEQFDIIVSLCDSMNYLMDEYELKSVFRGVEKILAPNGLYIFDMKTKAYYEEISDLTFMDEIENGSYIWENFFDEKTGDNNYYLTFFMKKCFGLYKKYYEEQIQHVFEDEIIQKTARDAGLRIRDILTLEGSKERIYYVMEKSEI